MTDQEYFAVDAVSASFLKTCALSSLAHARADADVPRKPTPAMALGSAFHAWALQPDVYEREWKNNKLFTGDNETAEARRNALQGMDDSIWRHNVAPILLSGKGPTEHAILWTEQSLPAKAKLDHICDGAVIELKTCSDASPAGFSRACFSQWRYDIQGAWYMRAARAAGLLVDRLIFVAVESAPPYLCAVYQLDQAALDNADEEIDILLPRIAEARKTGVWPGYPSGVNQLYLPAWMAGGVAS